MLQFFRKVWQRLWGRLRYCGAVHYLAGGPSLPPPLPPTQEKALLDRMAAGDAAAREELITHNLRLVVYLAKKYENSGVPAEDLVSIGTIADQGGKHLHPCPQHQAGHLRQPLHRQRDPDVPAQKLQPPAGGQHRRAFERGRRRQRAAALGHSCSDANAVSQQLEQDAERAVLRSAVAALSARERQIMELRFGLTDGVERTQKEAADALGISQSYISRLEKRIIRTLKARLESE